ncbi:MAG TPA: hypothetical protein VIP11_05630, partial [Gemmatimonadaceae bacterium]
VEQRRSFALIHERGSDSTQLGEFVVCNGQLVLHVRGLHPRRGESASGVDEASSGKSVVHVRGGDDINALAERCCRFAVRRDDNYVSVHVAQLVESLE